MRGKRAKLMRAHCDYDMKYERSIGRKYVRNKSGIGGIFCTGARDEYRAFKRMAKRRRRSLA